MTTPVKDPSIVTAADLEGIDAKVVLSSYNAGSHEQEVISTLLLRMPRCILTEFNTHRVFSRNAASSRAIPFEKMVKQIVDDPFIPHYWGMHQKGMQASVELTEDAKDQAIQLWLRSRATAVAQAESLHAMGLHKQIVNRLLEPWMYTVVCVTSTTWDNFLELRDHPAAEPHMQILARKIRACLESSQAVRTYPGEWHLPFVTDDEKVSLDLSLDDLKALSMARCASTSYKTVDGFDMTIERARDLHDKLVAGRPVHASPAEHVAQADKYDETVPAPEGPWEYPEQHRNFTGWRQYRAMLPFG